MESCQMQMELPVARSATIGVKPRKILRLIPHSEDSEPITKRSLSETEGLRCLALISASSIKSVLNELSLNGGECVVERDITDGFNTEELCRRGGGSSALRKILGREERLENGPVTHHEKPLAVVLKLADVARPQMLSQNRQEPRRNLGCTSPDALAIVLDEVARQDRNISAAIAKGRQVDD